MTNLEQAIYNALNTIDSTEESPVYIAHIAAQAAATYFHAGWLNSDGDMPYVMFMANLDAE